MFTSKVWTDDSGLLQELNLAAMQPQGATSVIQAITSEGLIAQGPYMAARGEVEPTTFRTEGIDNLHLTNHAPISWDKRRRRIRRGKREKNGGLMPVTHDGWIPTAQFA